MGKRLRRLDRAHVGRSLTVEPVLDEEEQEQAIKQFEKQAYESRSRTRIAILSLAILITIALLISAAIERNISMLTSLSLTSVALTTWTLETTTMSDHRGRPLARWASFLNGVTLMLAFLIKARKHSDFWLFCDLHIMPGFFFLLVAAISADLRGAATSVDGLRGLQYKLKGA